ncbi:hypothetical protein WNY79_20580 [Pseudoalteromonas sp. AS84]|uniref:hypothetical protein n=1 Tax=Pseudoalteromonas sp. AS84 TaxID=3135778 RepID=UPI00317C07B4
MNRFAFKNLSLAMLMSFFVEFLLSYNSLNSRPVLSFNSTTYDNNICSTLAGACSSLVPWDSFFLLPLVMSIVFFLVLKTTDKFNLCVYFVLSNFFIIVNGDYPYVFYYLIEGGVILSLLHFLNLKQTRDKKEKSQSDRFFHCRNYLNTLDKTGLFTGMAAEKELSSFFLVSFLILFSLIIMILFPFLSLYIKGEIDFNTLSFISASFIKSAFLNSHIIWFILITLLSLLSLLYRKVYGINLAKTNNEV